MPGLFTVDIQMEPLKNAFNDKMTSLQNQKGLKLHDTQITVKMKIETKSFHNCILCCT